MNVVAKLAPNNVNLYRPPLYQLIQILTVISSVVMAALCNRAGHYIFVLWFLFPGLISAIAE